MLLDSSGNSPAPWAMIALAAVTIVYVAVIRPMRKNKRKDPLRRAPSPGTLAQQRGVERDMANLLVEYEEMIRRMTAHVDTRAAKLELLIREADEKLARLRAAVADGPRPAGPAGADDGVAAGVAGALAEAVAEAGAAGRRPDVGKAAGLGPSTTPAAPPRVPDAAPVSGPDGAGRRGDRGGVLPGAGAANTDARHLEVYQLADRGQSARQIAQTLNRPHGEVELILALRGTRP